MGRVLIVVGLVVTGFGLMLSAGLPLGRLPGDLVFRRGGVTVYLPLGTSALISIVLSLAMWIGQPWWRR